MIRSSSSRPAVEDKGARGAPIAATLPATPSPASPTEAAHQYISPAPLDLVALLANAHHPGAGAVVLFSGEVRDNNRGRRVAYLEYEAYAPLASKMVKEILEEAQRKWELQIAVASHRTGRVNIGETAVVVITASPHRDAAYAANRYIIDRIKQEAPIWKCEYFADGTREWGNNCHCG